MKILFADTNKRKVMLLLLLLDYLFSWRDSP